MGLILVVIIIYINADRLICFHPRKLHFALITHKVNFFLLLGSFIHLGSDEFRSNFTINVAITLRKSFWDVAALVSDVIIYTNFDVEFIAFLEIILIFINSKKKNKFTAFIRFLCIIEFVI